MMRSHQNTRYHERMLSLMVMLFADVTAVSELAHAAYDVSAYASEGRVGDERVAYYCVRARDCRDLRGS